MFLPRSRLWLLLPIAAAAGIGFLVWCTRRLSLRAQFLVLLIMGVSISFVLLMIVQLPQYRPWLATLLVLIVFMASPIAVRIFLRGLTEEENQQGPEIDKHDP
jgi:Tfp pilus assembly protein PilN